MLPIKSFIQCQTPKAFPSYAVLSIRNPKTTQQGLPSLNRLKSLGGVYCEENLFSQGSVTSPETNATSARNAFGEPCKKESFLPPGVCQPGVERVSAMWQNNHVLSLKPFFDCFPTINNMS
jgi:hypothetical protein